MPKTKTRKQPRRLRARCCSGRALLDHHLPPQPPESLSRPPAATPKRPRSGEEGTGLARPGQLLPGTLPESRRARPSSRYFPGPAGSRPRSAPCHRAARGQRRPPPLPGDEAPPASPPAAAAQTRPSRQPSRPSRRPARRRAAG